MLDLLFLGFECDRSQICEELLCLRESSRIQTETSDFEIETSFQIKNMFYYLNFTISKPTIQFRNKDYSTNCDTIHGIKITGLIIFFNCIFM